jgi:mono/diheme cytochrome c family protein
VGFLHLNVEAMKMFRAPIWPFLAACGLLLAQWPAAAADDSSQTQPGTASVGAPDAQQTADAKAIFGAQCGWCHGDFGMKPDKGPRLAGTQMSEKQVEERIRNGKPGYMPSFRKFLNDDQIALMARYIKSLEAPPD